MATYDLDLELGGDSLLGWARARRSLDDRRCLLRTVRTGAGASRGERLLRCELEVAGRWADVDGVARPLEEVEHEGRFALLFEDSGGEPLDHFLSAGPLPLASALEVARQLAGTLAELHRRGFVHRAVRPANVLFDPSRGGALLAGLGFGTEVPRQRQRIEKPELVADTLAYVSPEMTGRTDRLIDYRTDFYALGATLFELLTGRPPFVAHDPLELVHAHVAQPPPPVEGVPPPVAAIVAKLLAKAAEDRYQGGDGLADDLERCARELRESGTIESFELGESDVPAHFELPQRLYGREAESAALAAALERAAGGVTEVVLLAGEAGAGKSSLVGVLKEHALARGAMLVTGKHDELERAIPYRGLRQALRQLVRRLLGDSTARLASYRRSLADALGPSLGVMVELIPELALIVGQTPEPDRLDANAAKNRFHLCVERFIRVFATADRPLVIFFDDLQWIDRSSLELGAACVPRGFGSCLLVGAFRSDEVGENHPLWPTLAGLSGQGVPVETLELAPLGRRHLLQLVSDALRTRPENAAPLAELVLQKCGGNPFFAKELLASLFERGLLSYAPRQGWTWDLERVGELRATDNVVELTARKIDALPDGVRRVVHLAAAFDSQFGATELAACGGLEESAVAEQLIAACREGILFKSGPKFRFVHDRVRESAYLRLPEADRAAAHLAIGRRLLQVAGDAAGGRQVFSAVHHLNRGRELLADPAERLRLARLNLEAGRRARADAAFPAAFGYLSAGLEALPPAAWQDHYDLARLLHTQAAEAACLSGDFAAAERLARRVHAEARGTLDQIPAYETRAAAAEARNRKDEALRLYLEALATLGIEIPFEADRDAVSATVWRVDQALEEALRKPRNELRTMKDPAHLTASRLLLRAIYAAAWTHMELLVLIQCRFLEHVLEHGHCPEAPFIYIAMGSHRCTMLCQLEGGFRSAEYGMQLLDDTADPAIRTACEITYQAFVQSWRVRPAELRAPFERSYREALEAGSFHVAATAAYRRSILGLVGGEKLDEVERMARSYRDEVSRLGQPVATRTLDRVLEVLDQLLRAGLPDETLPSHDVPEATAAGESADAPGAELEDRGRTVAPQAMVWHLFRRSGAMLEAVRRERFAPELPALLSYDFYRALMLADRHPEHDAARREADLVRVEHGWKKLSAYAREKPEIARHRADLVEAELRRSRGETLAAMALYERAAAGASRFGYLAEEGIANELAAELHLELGHSGIAAHYLAAAAGAYGRWGARAKVADLEARYGELLPPASGDPASGDPASDSAVSDALDLASLERATRALSQELDLAQLLRELMTVLMRNAGAQRGLLLRDDGGELKVEAGGSLDGGEIRVLGHEPLEACRDVARSVVLYVRRSHETVRLGDAGRDHRFASDPYVLRVRPRSILCAPILRQGRIVAILYLENNRIRDAFHRDRLAAVQLVCSQAAAALENARLHADLRQTLHELEAKNADLARFNYTVAHDLKNPLVTIQTFLGQMRRDVETGRTERLARDLARLQTAAGKLDRLLTELFELSRVGLKPNQPEDIPLGDLAREALDELPAASRAGVQVAPGLPMVRGDRPRLREALRHLLNNAVAYQSTHEPPRIEVGARRRRQEVLVHVQDNGVGIAPEYHQRVFELFERLDPRASEGTGVGLALVQRIVEIHGGRIWVESEGQGRGSTFYFTLPAAETGDA